MTEIEIKSVPSGFEGNMNLQISADTYYRYKVNGESQSIVKEMLLGIMGLRLKIKSKEGRI